MSAQVVAPLLLSVPEAAKALGIGRTNAYALLNEGALESVRIGHRRLIPAEALADYVARIRLEQS